MSHLSDSFAPAPGSAHLAETRKQPQCYKSEHSRSAQLLRLPSLVLFDRAVVVCSCLAFRSCRECAHRR